jgi:lipopolysaccharide transport system ATP-binding protein
MQVGAGQALGVIGQNGSGKTTLLKSLAGVIAPSRGRVVTRGRVASLIDLSAGVNRDLTGKENVMLGGVLLGMTRSEVRSKYDEIASFSGLADDVLQQPLSAYSTGMGLRIAFSVVACSEPSILLVDEVLAVGDESFQRKCFDRLDLFRRSGCAIVIATHDLNVVVERTDQAIVLRSGHLVDSGHPKELVARYEAMQQADSQITEQEG